MQPPPALIQHTNLSYTYLMGLNKYQKCDCTSSNVTLYQKSIFDFLNPLWDIFRFIFRQLRITFLIMVFLQMHNKIWQRVR